MVFDITIAPTNGFHATPADAALYQRVNDFLLGRLGGDSEGYKAMMRGFNIQGATGSNSPFVVAADELLQGTDKRILTLDDAVKIYADGQAIGKNHFEGVYADIPQQILYSNDRSTFTGNLAGIASNQKVSYDQENPARFTGLKLSRGTSGGITFEETNRTSVVSDPRFAYSNNGKEVDFGTLVKVFTRDSGVSGLFAGNYGLGAGYDDLTDSDDDGRVVVVDAEGVANKK